MRWSRDANSSSAASRFRTPKAWTAIRTPTRSCTRFATRVLGALGEQDIGHFFPNTDPRWKDAPSKVFLQEAARLVALRQGKIVNVDATVIAQAPKIYPHIRRNENPHRRGIGHQFPKHVGIKATTNEKMGFIGREEGIAAMAVASVDL